MADNKLRLSIKAADGTTKTIDFSGTSLIIGSGEEAGVRVNDAKVSDLHVRLRLKDGQLFATDLASDEGTTADGQKVSKETPVKPGQTLALGETRITIEGELPEAGDSKSKAPGKGSRRPTSSRKGSTDGNAARALDADDESETQSITPVMVTPSTASVSASASSKKSGGAVGTSSSGTHDPRLKDYAARFLAEELPEALRPTASDKRLQVALVWGKDQFLDIKDISSGHSLTAGDAPNATLQISHASLKGAVALVQPSDQGFRVLLPAAASPRVRVDGRELSLDELKSGGKANLIDVPVKGASYELGLNDRVTLEFGNLRVIARYTKPTLAVARPLGDRIDVNFLSTLAILLLFAIAFERMIAITDFSGWNVVDDLFKNKDRFAKYIAAAEEKKKPDTLSGVKEGAKAKNEEGKFGKKEADKPKAAPSKPGAPVVDKDKREQDRQKVANSGLFAAFGKNAGATSDVLGPGGLGTGTNDAFGGIHGGAAAGDAEGMGGLGARGGGSGGGGTGLGIGGLGGHGNGRGRGGNGEFDLGGKGKGTTQFIPGKTTVIGGLTADEIGKVVRKHWLAVKYCYEKELQKNPALQGKVAVYWEIGPLGDVTIAQVKESDMNNADAESCIVGVVRRMVFPQPRGGGVVNVNYPWIFKSQ
jgi:hypothetical protein